MKIRNKITNDKHEEKENNRFTLDCNTDDKRRASFRDQ